MMSSCFTPLLAGAVALAALSGGFPAFAQGGGGAAAMAKLMAPSGLPTPKRADGHPDLNGTWQPANPNGNAGGPGVSAARGADGSIKANLGRTESPNFDVQPAWPPNQPAYKPELRAKVVDVEAREPFTDSVFACGQPGIPRIGAPQKIIQTDKEIVFLYADLAGQVWRIIPMNRKKLPDDTDSSRYGDSMAHWDGDTLVVDSGNFDTVTWFWEYGDFHSDKMTLRETFRRDGPKIIYQATVTDPEVLVQPWVANPKVLLPATEEIFEQPACTATDPAKVPKGHHNQR
jgi:hypothetical protein